MRWMIAAWIVFTATPVAAAEMILFDGNECTGEYRMLDRSVVDLRQMNFDNKANSVRIFAGGWTLYRDHNYGNRNGPSIRVAQTPSEQGGTGRCLDIASVLDGVFPANRLSSVALDPDTASYPRAVAIIYDRTRLRGAYRILTRDVADFDHIDFDNDAASIRVVRGRWEFYRDADFGERPDRPRLLLEVGEYPEIHTVTGYPRGHFPRDLMSSARPDLQ